LLVEIEAISHRDQTSVARDLKVFDRAAGARQCEVANVARLCLFDMSLAVIEHAFHDLAFNLFFLPGMHLQDLN